MDSYDYVVIHVVMTMSKSTGGVSIFFSSVVLRLSVRNLISIFSVIDVVAYSDAYDSVIVTT